MILMRIVRDPAAAGRRNDLRQMTAIAYAVLVRSVGEPEVREPGPTPAA